MCCTRRRPVGQHSAGRDAPLLRAAQGAASMACGGGALEVSVQLVPRSVRTAWQAGRCDVRSCHLRRSIYYSAPVVPRSSFIGLTGDASPKPGVCGGVRRGWIWSGRLITAYNGHGGPAGLYWSMFGGVWGCLGVLGCGGCGGCGWIWWWGWGGRIVMELPRCG